MSHELNKTVVFAAYTKWQTLGDPARKDFFVADIKPNSVTLVDDPKLAKVFDERGAISAMRELKNNRKFAADTLTMGEI